MGERLENKVALITGGGSGIGAATALRFAQEGALVCISGRREQPLNEVATLIADSGGRVQTYVSDAGDEFAFAELIQSVVADCGRLDILVNNAASIAGGSLISDTPTDEWRGTFSVTLDGLFYGTRAAMKLMSAQGGGAIVNLSSVCGLLGTPYTGAYAAAKAGVIGLSRTAAIEGASSNVRVNVVIPGVVMTPATQVAIPDEASLAFTAATVPIKRIAEASEIANAILFLASDEASYITGTELVVDGGKSAELNTGAASMDGHEM
ncbi:MAG: SDR family NAD(P)-dependent oxidoreductase [Pseudomonadales bacterium]